MDRHTADVFCGQRHLAAVNPDADRDPDCRQRLNQHVVGVSGGGAFAQLLALAFPDRVLSLVLISTSPATPGERSLPSATERFGGFLASPRWIGRIEGR